MVYISKKPLHCTREQKYVSKDICVKRVCVYLYTDIWEENNNVNTNYFWDMWL